MQYCCKWMFSFLHSRLLSKTMFLKAAIGKTMVHDIKTVLYLFLLTFYMAGTSQFEALHGLFHPHDHTVAHSAAQEQGACHRAIYHSYQDKGCGHHSHIVVADKCELCDLIVHTDQIFLPAFESKTLQFFTIGVTFSAPTFVGICQTIDSSRAPPIV